MKQRTTKTPQTGESIMQSRIDDYDAALDVVEMLASFHRRHNNREAYRMIKRIWRHIHNDYTSELIMVEWLNRQWR